MGLFSFLKNAGSKIFKKDEETVSPEVTAEASAEEVTAMLKQQKSNLLKSVVESLDLPTENLGIDLEGDVVTLTGGVDTQANKEKIILAVGNVNGIASVDDQMVVTNPEPEAVFYTVQSGDSLSKIAKAHYGNAMKYPQIFEANKPMLSSPDKIYPGQVLRIPQD